MTVGVALVLTGTVAALAFGCSILWAVALGLGWRWLSRITHAAQSRVLLAAALAPGLASGAVVAAIVFDLLALRSDSHRCLLHAAAGSSPFVVGLAALLAIRIGLIGSEAFRALYHSRRVSRTLESVASRGDGESRVVPIDEPQAFVVGVLRPRMYLSRGLLRTADPRDLEAVIAHEHSHIRRRDPLRRLIASFGLAFHLPGIASAIERRLAATQESAADADAARAIGDGPRIAEALVKLARLRVARLPQAIGALDGDLEFRVNELLSPPARADRPSAGLVIALAASLLAVALLVADPIHTAFESLVRFLNT